MKKSLIVLAVALILCVAVIMSAYAVISPRADDVVLTETVLDGDKAAAADVTVLSHTHLDYRLHWDTVHTVGQEPETDFRFTQGQDYPEYEYIPDGIYPTPDNYYTSYYSTGADVSEEDRYGYAGLVLELMDEATPHVEFNKTVYLKDYMEYIPIYSSGDMGRISWDYDDEIAINKKLRDYFKIPVGDNTAEVTLMVDDDGDLMMENVWTDLYNYSYSTVVGNKSYFTLNWFEQSSSEEMMDFSQVPGGFGVYCIELAYEDDENTDQKILDAEGMKISTVYSLDVSQEPVYFDVSSNGENLLLFTCENGETWLNVIDIETYETEQRLQLFTGFEAESFFNTVYEVRDSLVVFTGSENFEVLELTEEGYRVAFSGSTGKMLEALGEKYWYNNIDMDFDGERLAVAINFDASNYESCNYILAVYDAEGVQYMGMYESSLTSVRDNDYNKNCRYIDEKPLEVRIES